jgi:DNA-binding response OmpR family regulator
MNPLSAPDGRYFLIVDSDPLARTQVHKFLTELGHQLVLEATTIKESLEFINSHRIAGLVVDWEAPDAGGYALLKLIRGQSKFAQTLFIMMARPDAFAQHMIVKAGSLKADGFLLKPFSMSALELLLQKQRSAK